MQMTDTRAARTYTPLILLLTVQRDEDSKLLPCAQFLGSEDPPVCHPEAARHLYTVEAAIDRMNMRQFTQAGMASLGRSLTLLALPSEIMRQHLSIQLALHRSRGDGLRLCLILDAGLRHLPWEYLSDPLTATTTAPVTFLARDPHVSVVRLEHSTLHQRLRAAPRTPRILIAGANPLPDAPLDNIAHDLSTIEQLWDQTQLVQHGGTTLTAEQRYGVIAIPDATLDRVQPRLAPYTDIFHFAGHGENVHGGSLLFADEEGGAHISAPRLLATLRESQLQVAILVACDSAVRDPGTVWYGFVHPMLANGIPIVIGMQFRIHDASAHAWTRAVYDALFKGMSLDEAMTRGRQAIADYWLDAPDADCFAVDWGVPVMYSQTSDVFRLPEPPLPPLRPWRVLSFRSEIHEQWQEIASHLPPGATYAYIPGTEERTTTQPLPERAMACVESAALAIDGKWHAVRSVYVPGLAPLAMTVIAALHGRKRTFPHLLRMIPEPDGSWRFAELVDLDEIRLAAEVRQQTSSGHTFTNLVIFDFSQRPITEDDRHRVQVLLNLETAPEVVGVPSGKVDQDLPLRTEIARLVDSLSPQPDRWSACRFLVNPPGLANVAVALMAELRGRTGRLPRIIHRGEAADGGFEVVDIIDLHTVRSLSEGR